MAIHCEISYQPCLLEFTFMYNSYETQGMGAGVELEIRLQDKSQYTQYTVQSD